MTQNEVLLRALKRGEVLTTMKAFRKWGITRLAARIRELRDHHDIRATMIERGGKRFAAYRLA